MEFIIGLTNGKGDGREEAFAFSSSSSCSSASRIVQEVLPILTFNLQHWV